MKGVSAEREWSGRLLEPAGVHLLVAAFLVAGEVVGEGEAEAAVGAHLEFHVLAAPRVGEVGGVLPEDVVAVCLDEELALERPQLQRGVEVLHGAHVPRALLELRLQVVVEVEREVGGQLERVVHVGKDGEAGAVVGDVVEVVVALLLQEAREREARAVPFNL